MADPAADLTDERIRCRAARFHDWKPETASKVVGGWESWEKCGRDCGCRRYSYRSNTGKVLRRVVQYPPGYLMPKGKGLTAADIERLSLLVFHWDFDPLMEEPAPRKSAARKRAS